jgi:hypothetical protein
MPNPEFILQEAIHITARIDALANYNGIRSDLAIDITRRERELWDNVRQREHAARLQAEALQPTAA